MTMTKTLAGRLAMRCCAVIGLMGALTPANAINIVLNPDDSFLSSPNGAAALFGFQKAANYWNQTLSGNQTLSFDIHFSGLGAGILGSTASNTLYTSAVDVYRQLGLTGSKTPGSLDSMALANLHPLSAAGGIGYRTPGIDPATGLTTATAAGSVYDNNDTDNNLYLNTNTTINKAIGMSVDYNESYFQALNDAGYDYRPNADADITFSSSFGFDFDPTDGISAGTYDFVSTATHEMAHALGFVSGTDDYDYNIGYQTLADVQDTPTLTTLDLFRYGANNPDAGSNGYDIQLDPNRPAFFSVDGSTPFNFGGQDATSSFFSTGSNFGDGQQASHWNDSQGLYLNNNCFVSDRQAGIMDPTEGACQPGVVTSNDLAAMDAMGWNLGGLDITKDKGYTFTTAQIYNLPGLAAVAGVPEPSTWAMMLIGFGAVAATLRRRRKPAGTLAAAA